MGQKLERVLTKNQVMLNDIISLTPLSIANEMLQIGIISREILSSSAHESISFEKIIRSFMVILNISKADLSTPLICMHAHPVSYNQVDQSQNHFCAPQQTKIYAHNTYWIFTR